MPKTHRNGPRWHGKAIYGLLALNSIFGAPARCQTPSSTEQVIDVNNLKDCGMITRYPGDVIASNCFQQSENILTDRTGVIARRNGYSQYNASQCPTGNAPIRGMWPFFADNGTQYLIMLSSGSMLYSPGDGSCNYIPGLEGSVNGSATMECVQSGANGGNVVGAGLWCTDGIDPVFVTNAVSTQAVTQAPIGFHIGTFRNRILISGVPGTGSGGSGSQVYLSGELNGLDYTIPAVQLTTSPAIISVNGINDGQIVTCLMGEFQNQYLIGRKYDLWGLSGYDLSDFALRKISSQVGCLEPRSVQEVTNVLYWLSERGVEGYTGTQINRVSYPIDQNILPIIASAGNTRTQTLTTQGDWQSGNLTASGAGAPMSATISPGDVVPSSWSINDIGPSTGTSVITQGAGATFINAGAESNNFDNWTTNSVTITPSGNSIFSSFSTFGSFAWSSQIIIGGGVSACSANSSSMTIRIVDFNGNYITGSTMTLTESTNNSITYNTSGTTASMIQILIDMYSSQSHATMRSALFLRPDSVTIHAGSNGTAASGKCFALMDIDESISRTTSGIYTSPIFDTTFSTPTWGVFSTSISSGGTNGLTFQVQSSTANDGGGFSSLTSQNVNVKIAAPQSRYLRYAATFTVNTTTNTQSSYTDNLSAETTGYYITPCILVSSPTSWGNFLADGVTNGGSFNFWISTGSTCGIATQTNANWTAQTANSVISVSTTTEYIAARVLFSVNSATQVPTLNDMTFTWNNGASRPPTASARWDDRYLLFFTTNTASGAVNDHAFIYDQNQKWQLWDDEHAASATLYQNTLYTGDSNPTGLVYIQDVGQSDNGNPFSMTFQTADFDGGDPNMNKQFSRAYIMLGAPNSGNGSASLSCNYSLDGSSSTYSLGTVTLSESPEAQGYFVAKLPFPVGQPVTGHWINMTCTASGTVGPISVHRIRLVYTPTGWD